ncbi:protein of unknown function [Methylocella tundrae]|uniref:Uncharacterized protein n=1 Tax=Methylocella tundrae TaxID=227605 RepID=A0A4U8YWL0_METTU|nr:protein of unknown function [Methylocella tundrae]
MQKKRNSAQSQPGKIPGKKENVIWDEVDLRARRSPGCARRGRDGRRPDRRRVFGIKLPAVRACRLQRR